MYDYNKSSLKLVILVIFLKASNRFDPSADNNKHNNKKRIKSVQPLTRNALTKGNRESFLYTYININYITKTVRYKIFK